MDPGMSVAEAPPRTPALPGDARAKVPRAVVAKALAGPLIRLAIVLALPALLSPYWMRLVMQAFVMIIAMLGLYVLIGLTGQISLAQAAFMGIGAYATTVLTTVHGVPFFVAVPIAIICSVPLAALLAVPAMRVGGILLAVVTLGFSYAADYSLFVTHWLTGFPNGRPINRPSFLESDTAFYYAAFLVCAACVVSVMKLASSRLGRAFQAVRDGEHAAAASGISVVGVKLTAFVIAGLLGGVAGALYAPMVGYTNGGVAFTGAVSLALLIVGVLAGLGSVRGAIIGGFVYALAPGFALLIFRNSLSTFSYQQIIFSGVLILALVRNPDGLVAHAAHRKQKKLEKKQRKAEELRHGAA